ncbi:hypothetical protein AVS7_04305 [Acidovorax sp. MR-S7]|nr:hypothetical protein AVS7_04305 [Acidovorax sp. MR-S7]
MKAHIGVDADSGLVHTVRGTAGSVNDVIEANTLLHGEETEAWGDAGYQGADKRPDAKAGVRWNIAMHPGKRKLLDRARLVDELTDQLERLKASIRAKVEHPFRVIKRQFGHVKVRYRGLVKNTAQLHTLFALSNLWMARSTLMGAQACVRLQTAERPGNGPKTASPRVLAKLRRRIGLAAPHQHISKRIAQTFLNATTQCQSLDGGGRNTRLLDDPAPEGQREDPLAVAQYLRHVLERITEHPSTALMSRCRGT